MNKVLIIGDVHFSTYSSILRSRGDEYSTRLENLIKSLNWAEHLAIEKNVDRVIYLGDFFDKPDLTAEEISALNKINWCDKPHHFIVGNHEANTASLAYNSTNVLRKLNFDIVDSVKYFTMNDTAIYMLPYVIEDNRKSISDLDLIKANKTIIFSHNDLKGVHYGGFESKTGYELADIEKNCDLFINGHLHNGEWISKKIRNLGNLTGQNFSEDAFKYSHNVMILDVDDLSYEDIENPYALNFYKLDLTDSSICYKLKKNAVITAKCLKEELNDVARLLSDSESILAAKLVTTSNLEYNRDEVNIDLSSVDHLKQFTSFITDKLGLNDIVIEELSEVCK